MTGLDSNDIALRVKRLFGDESGVQVTDADILAWVNDAIREAYFQNDEIKRQTVYPTLTRNDQRVTVTPVGGSASLTIESVHYRESLSGAFYQIPYMSPRAFNEFIPDWDASNLTAPSERNLPSGVPLAWTRGNGPAEINLYPAAPYDGEGRLKVVIGVGPSQVLTMAEDLNSFIPDHLHNYVIEFCMMKAYELDEDWEAVRIKGEIVQSTLDFNQGRDSWVGRDTYPIIVPSSDDM